MYCEVHEHRKRASNEEINKKTKPLDIKRLAGWQSGHAAACKAAYVGSIPALASS